MRKKLYKRCHFFLNVAVAISSFFLLFTTIFAIGCGGILNSLDDALIEMQELEKNGLLDNPPAHISPITKREIGLVKNSTGLKLYIKENELSAEALYKAWLTLIVFLFFLIVIKTGLYIYKRKDSLL